MPERTLPALFETSVETLPRNELIREKTGSGYVPTTCAEMRILVDCFKDTVNPQDRTIFGRLVARRVQQLRGDRPLPDLGRRAAIVVDDGLASGFTLMVAIEALRRQGARNLVVAVPTAHADSVARIAPLVEALCCPNVREGLSYAVADAYEQWSDLAEDTVVELLKPAGAPR